MGTHCEKLRFESCPAREDVTPSLASPANDRRVKNLPSEAAAMRYFVLTFLCMIAVIAYVQRLGVQVSPEAHCPRESQRQLWLPAIQV